jgi:hypothetical protein
MIFSSSIPWKFQPPPPPEAPEAQTLITIHYDSNKVGGEKRNTVMPIFAVFWS